MTRFRPDSLFHLLTTSAKSTQGFYPVRNREILDLNAFNKLIQLDKSLLFRPCDEEETEKLLQLHVMTEDRTKEIERNDISLMTSKGGPWLFNDYTLAQPTSTHRSRSLFFQLEYECMRRLCYRTTLVLDQLHFPDSITITKKCDSKITSEVTIVRHLPSWAVLAFSDIKPMEMGYCLHSEFICPQTICYLSRQVKESYDELTQYLRVAGTRNEVENYPEYLEELGKRYQRCAALYLEEIHRLQIHPEQQLSAIEKRIEELKRTPPQTLPSTSPPFKHSGRKSFSTQADHTLFPNSHRMEKEQRQAQRFEQKTRTSRF